MPRPATSQPAKIRSRHRKPNRKRAHYLNTLVRRDSRDDERGELIAVIKGNLTTEELARVADAVRELQPPPEK